MRPVEGTLRLSASDLAKYLGCRFLTVLDRAAAEGRIEPMKWRDPRLEVLQERGFEHERSYLEYLKQNGKSVFHVEAGDDFETAYERTVSAMRTGVDIIAQATLPRARWLGRADTLERVEVPSSLGDWSYEVCDTKLARETQGGTILQLCLYSDLVGEIQGHLPESMFVVPPGNDLRPQRFRVLDFIAYYRHVRRALQKVVDSPASDPEAPQGLGPEPVPHCDRCSWWPYCRSRWEREDHLSLVAGISKLQRDELQSRNVGTLADLGRLPTPFPWKPDRGSIEAYQHVREQARIQLEGRTYGKVLYEVLPLEPGRGLAELPEPSPGDIFFDIEGDPFVGTDGREYLFGYAVMDEASEPRYDCDWAWTPAEEKATFEAFVDFVGGRLEQFPDLHIYHFGSYEPATLKRLMGRYATRENQIDRLLRGERFVDLLTIVKRSIRASVESYSIKELEPLYGFERDVKLEDAKGCAACRRARSRAGPSRRDR